MFCLIVYCAVVASISTTAGPPPSFHALPKEDYSIGSMIYPYHMM